MQYDNRTITQTALDGFKTAAEAKYGTAVAVFDMGDHLAAFHRDAVTVHGTIGAKLTTREGVRFAMFSRERLRNLMAKLSACDQRVYVLPFPQ